MLEFVAKVFLLAAIAVAVSKISDEIREIRRLLKSADEPWKRIKK